MSKPESPMIFSASDLLPLLSKSPFALIDVRSETEFAQSGIDGFVSLPLLYQHERSQVGIEYKHKGQEAAIALGHKLVDPHRDERVRAWGGAILRSEKTCGLIMCWRGGLRSKIASEWIREAGFEALQLSGGYKELRHRFLETFAHPPPLIVLSGMTGSGKTEMLRDFPESKLDLEAAAAHRGSSFGQMSRPQPTQTRFENRVALDLLKPKVLLEDESRMLGRLSIPETLFQAMQAAPAVYLECSLPERVARIFEEYIAQALHGGLSYEALHAAFQTNLRRLQQRLDRHYADIRKNMDRAFGMDPDLEAHRDWISSLLIHYYDKRYLYSSQKASRTAIFRGDRKACREFLRSEGLC